MKLGQYIVRLLLVGLLASCGSTSPSGTTEEPAAQTRTYALSGELFGDALAGELTLDFLDIAEVDPAGESTQEKHITGTLALDDGTARQVYGSLSGVDIVLTFFMADQLIEGSGKASGEGGFSGTFLSGDDAQRVEGSWQAALQDSVQDSAQDSAGQ